VFGEVLGGFAEGEAAGAEVRVRGVGEGRVGVGVLWWGARAGRVGWIAWVRALRQLDDLQPRRAELPGGLGSSEGGALTVGCGVDSG